jgi:hypothetical protein
MPTNTNVQSTAAGIINHATGQIVTTSATAAAVTITCGFVPRVIRVYNDTDRISDEWLDGMDENALMVAIAGITAKLDSDGGVTDTDHAALWNPTTATIDALKVSLVGLLAKLDAGAGVTDTNYAALWTPVATIAGLIVSINGLTAKLDADGGVTDTDYAAIWATTAAVSKHTVANGTKTLELVNGIRNNYDGTFTLNATTMAASKKFTWEAIG